MKKRFLKFLTFLTLSFFLGSSVLASNVTDISIPSDEKIFTDFIQAGENVDVAGDVAGDVILAGGNVSFSGEADGDILMAGGNLRIKGDSLGDVRAVGGNVILDGLVEKNVTIAGGSVILEENSVINGNIYIAGENVEIRGKVNGDVTIYSSQILLSGDVAGDADFRSNNIILRSDASILGNLTYSAQTDYYLDNSEIIQGEVSRVEISKYLSENNNDNNNLDSLLGIWRFLGLFLLGFIFFKLLRKQAKKLIVPIKKDEVWRKIASGLISLIFNPVIIIISFVSVIGIPFGLLSLFLYILLFISASVLSPVLIGGLLNSKINLYAKTDKNLWIDFLIGYVIMEVIKIIPILGGIILLMVFLFSFGRVTRLVWGIIKENR